MQTLYNSASFTVVAFEMQTADDGPAQPASRGGYEIVDKFSRKEIFIQGEVAASLQQGVQAIVAQGPDEETLDAFIAGFAQLAQHPVLLHLAAGHRPVVPMMVPMVVTDGGGLLECGDGPICPNAHSAPRCGPLHPGRCTAWPAGPAHRHHRRRHGHDDPALQTGRG